MTSPLLNSPCSGWDADLPGPFDQQQLAKHLENKIPNHLDTTYLELPRSSVSPRGVLFFVTIIFILVYVSILVFLFFIIPPQPVSLIGGTTLLIFGSWMVTIGWQLDVSPPRDEPIRFNRIRRKIYAYNFKNQYWNPFKKGMVIPVSYDWSQVRAERWSQTGMVAGGPIFKWGVVLSIIEPGTNRVIDRFNLSAMDTDGQTWAYVCTYMQKGPDAPSARPSKGPQRSHLV